MVLRPEPSPDGRTTLGNIYNLQVRYYLTDDYDGLTADTSEPSGGGGATHAASIIGGRSRMQQLRSMLMKYGSTLEIVGMGFDMVLNDGTAGTLWDVRWGPKPIQCQIRPVGDGIVWQIDWTCEFCLPECVNIDGDGHAGHTTDGSGPTDDNPSFIDFPYVMGSVESLVYNFSYSIDQSGFTTRTVEGALTIALHRASVTGAGASTAVTKTADEYRSNFRLSIPPHFRRLQEVFTLSNDRRTLSFNVVDQELPDENSRIPGVVDMELVHNVNTEGMGLPGNSSLTCSIRGSIEVTKNHSKALAFSLLVMIIQQRLDIAKKYFQDLKPVLDPNASGVFLTSVNVTEHIYGSRVIDIDVGYMIMRPSVKMTYIDLVGSSGLFKSVNPGGDGITPVPGLDEDSWALSHGFDRQNVTFLPRGTWSQRGHAGLEFLPEEDVIVGPCDENSVVLLGDYVPPTPVSSGGGSLFNGCPPEGYDYVSWDSWLKIIQDDKVIQHNPIKLPESTPTTRSTKSDDGAQLSISARVYDAADGTPPEIPVETLTAGTLFKVCLEGKAIRLGKPPEVPQINFTRFQAALNNGVDPEDDPDDDDDAPVTVSIYPCRDGSDNPNQLSSSYRGNLGVCPIYAGEWKTCYCMMTHDDLEIKRLLAAIRESLVFTESDPDGRKVGDQPESTPPTPTP